MPTCGAVSLQQNEITPQHAAHNLFPYGIGVDNQTWAPADMPDES